MSTALATDAGADTASSVTTAQEGWTVVTDIGHQDWGSAIADMQSFLNDAQGEITDAASDPIGYLISQGLSFLEHYFTPLNDMINQVTGNPDAATAAADDWRDISADMAQMSRDMADLAGSFDSWQGTGHDTAVQQLTKFSSALDGISGEVAQMANALEISGSIMQAAKDLINSILSTLIEWAVWTFLAAQAAAPITFGASEGVAAAAIEGESAVQIERGTRVVSKLESLIIRVRKLLPELKEVLKDALKDGATSIAQTSADVALNGSHPATQTNQQIDTGLRHPISTLPSDTGASTSDDSDDGSSDNGGTGGGGVSVTTGDINVGSSGDHSTHTDTTNNDDHSTHYTDNSQHQTQVQHGDGTHQSQHQSHPVTGHTQSQHQSSHHHSHD